MKIKLSGDILSILYMIPIALAFFTFMFLILGSVDNQIKDFYLIFEILGIIILIIWILFRQCKIVYFDIDNMYIHTVFKNKFIKKIGIDKISNLSFVTFVIRITYWENEHKKRNYYTIPDRKTMDDELGFSNLPCYKFLYGKPNNKILMLKELVKSKIK